MMFDPLRSQSSDRPSWTGGVARSAGVVDPKKLFFGSTTPSARNKEASRSLLGRAATPPVQEGRSRNASGRRGSNTLLCLAVFLVLIAVLALLPITAHAQCALCVTALEQSPEGRAMAGSFNRGILFLLAAPYAVFGTVGVVVYRAYRKKKLEAQRNNPYIPKT